MKRLNILTLIAAFLTFFACQENDSIEIDGEDKNLIKFETYEDYINTKNEISEFNDKEKITWLKSKISDSYYIKALDVYNPLIEDDFKSEEEILAYIEENKNFITLKEAEETNEYYADIKLNEHFDIYFLNSDRIFQIENKLHKLLDETIIKADISEMEVLKNINESNLNNLPETFEVVRKYNVESPNLKTLEVDGCYQNTRKVTIRKTNGKNRLRVTLEGEVDKDRIVNRKDHTLVVHMRPYKRSFGVWINVPRTIDFSCHLRIEYEKNYSLEQDILIFSGNKSETRNYRIPFYYTGNLLQGTVSNSPDPDFFFRTIYFRGNTPNIDQFTYDCPE